MNLTFDKRLTEIAKRKRFLSFKRTSQTKTCSQDKRIIVFGDSMIHTQNEQPRNTRKVLMCERDNNIIIIVHAFIRRD